MAKLHVLVITMMLMEALVCSSALPVGDENTLGYCHYKGLSIEEGKTVPAPIGICQKITCTNAASNTIGALTCPLAQLPPEKTCHFTDKDLAKPWPKCCPKIVCED